jgi:hypothetical protein
MRRRISVTALAVAALLAVIPMAAGAAHAAVPSAAAADDIFYPEGDAANGDAANAPASDADSAPADSTQGGGSPADREAALARGSRQAADLMGVMPSLYQGRWFVASREDTRRCILLRESHANYRASNGTYHGAYQMSSALAIGATWMMQKEVRKEMGAEGVALVEALRKTTPNNWNRYWQDRAFWTIWRDGAGAGHWGGAGGC